MTFRYSEVMAIMLELKPDVEARLVSQAEADGLPVNDYVEKLVQEHAGTRAPRETPQEFAARLMRIVKKFDELPTLDHRSADEIIGYDEYGLPSR